MSTRAGVLVRSIALGACALALSAEVVIAQRKDAKPSQKEISRELRELYESDQKDQNDESWNEGTGAEFDRRQTVRRNRVMEIIEAGMLADLQDWDRAAMLLQHGDTPDDYLLAHILSMPCGIADQPGGKFMCAATLDRFLQNVGRPQIFTTQSGAADPSLYAPAKPFDDSMSQSLRALFDLPPFPGREEGPEQKGKGPSTKDLPKLLELSRKEPATEDVPEWLQSARDIARGGALKSEKDFDLAARVLSGSSDPDDLLWAHVLAMAGAFKARSPASRVSCAETLDRFLVAIGRKQRFDTLRENGAPKEPRMPLQEFILREYGLAAR
jgi:hypothetical protein